MKASKKKELLNIFEELYPNPESELNFKNRYQLLVSVMLSAQCTDKKVNDTTPALFKRYPSFKALSEASLDEVLRIIRPINYYKTKAKHLIEMAKLVRSNFSGKVPLNHKDLQSLPGVGQKTANVILGELEIEPSFPVDTHVFRVSKRLGLAEAKTREAVEEELKKAFKAHHWRNLHHWLIFHGRRLCKARNPLCHECPINFCPSREEKG